MTTTRSLFPYALLYCSSPWHVLRRVSSVVTPLSGVATSESQTMTIRLLIATSHRFTRMGHHMSDLDVLAEGLAAMRRGAKKTKPWKGSFFGYPGSTDEWAPTAACALGCIAISLVSEHDHPRQIVLRANQPEMDGVMNAYENVFGAVLSCDNDTHSRGWVMRRIARHLREHGVQVSS